MKFPALGVVLDAAVFEQIQSKPPELFAIPRCCVLVALEVLQSSLLVIKCIACNVHEYSG